MRLLTQEILLQQHNHGKHVFGFYTANGEENSDEACRAVENELLALNQPVQTILLPTENSPLNCFAPLKLAGQNTLTLLSGGSIFKGPATPIPLSQVDGAILIIKAGQTAKPQIKEMLAWLARHQVPVCGAILAAVKKVVPNFIFRRLSS